MNAPLAKDRLSRAAATAAFLRGLSVEITPKQVDKLPLLKEKLAPGSQVFIALIDAGDRAAQITIAQAVSAAGFAPVPHVPARFIVDEADLKSRIQALGRRTNSHRQCGSCWWRPVFRAAGPR